MSDAPPLNRLFTNGFYGAAMSRFASIVSGGWYDVKKLAASATLTWINERKATMTETDKRRGTLVQKDERKATLTKL